MERITEQATDTDYNYYRDYESSNNSSSSWKYILLLIAVIAGVYGIYKYSNIPDLFNNLPTEDQALKKVQDGLTKTQMNLIHIESLKKLNGVKRTVFGQDIYSMEYEAVVTFSSNAHVYGKTTESNLESVITDEEYKWNLNKVYEMKVPLPDGTLSHNKRDFINSYLHFKKGNSYRFTGSLDFEKTENGWR